MMVAEHGNHGWGLMDKVRMTLDGIDGNAFALLGAFAINANRQGWPERKIAAVRQEAMAGNYDHLLQTLIAHTERPEGSDG
jgi:hypothetical protein